MAERKGRGRIRTRSRSMSTTLVRYLIPDAICFLRYVMIGGIVLMVLTVPDLRNFTGRIEDLGAPTYMPLFRNRAYSSRATPFVFVDIDEATHAEWGREPWVPRDKLKELITKAASAGPQLIIVDVDLSYPYCNRGQLAEKAPTNSWLVQEVKTILEEHSDLHIILMQSTRNDTDASPSLSHNFLCEKEFASSDTSRLHWVVPTVRADVDLVVRDWPLYAQNSDAPSIPGLGPLSRAVKELNGPQSTDECIQHIENFRRKEKSEYVSALALCLTGKVVDGMSMIVFTIPWKLDDGETWPVLDGGAPLLTRIAAQSLLAAKDIAPLSGRFVIIGGSYLDSRDFHPTPIGVMIVNAIHSFLEFGAVASPGLRERLFVGTLALLIGAWAFATFPPVLATVVSVILVGFMTAALAYYQLWPSIWLDATLPLFAIGATHWVSEVVDLLRCGIRTKAVEGRRKC